MNTLQEEKNNNKQEGILKASVLKQPQALMGIKAEGQSIENPCRI